MNIILKKQDDRYGFVIANSLNKAVYSSFVHYFLTPSVKSSYKYAWEACRDAWKLALRHPYHINGFKFARYDMDTPVTVDISAEEMLVTHYMIILRDLRRKAKGAGVDKEERKKTYQEVKMVINEINTVIGKITEPKEKSKMGKVLHLFQSIINKFLSAEKREDKEAMGETKLASCISQEFDQQTLDDDIKRELIDDYAQRCCSAIQDKHPDVYYVTNPDLNEIVLMDFENNPLLKIKLNDYLSIDSIVPMDRLYKIYPFHSVAFYQKYWKPIVESVGHISIGNPAVLIRIDANTLPDVPKVNQSYSLEGWNIKERTNTNVDISFNGERPTWIFKPSQGIKTAQAQEVSKYTEQDYVNAMVECIDPKLKSIYGRTGVVIQIIPLEDIVEIDIDFGRGLGVIRLTESQIQIVPIGE